MQCYQPLCGYGSFPNCSASMQYMNGIYPELIGEGEVTSLTLADGTVQFLFTPTVKWSPYQINPNVTGTWLVRSNSNPYPTTPCNPHYQRHEHPLYLPSCNTNAPYTGFQIKFHSDKWTSTTDIHYFYPSLRRCNYTKLPTQECVAVQVEIPTANKTICHYVSRPKPCQCITATRKQCYNRQVSKMSNARSSHSKSSLKSKKGRQKRIDCLCDKYAPKIESTDKSVTTYSDKACSCASIDGHGTQTRGISTSASKIQTELCYPTTPLNRNAMETCSSIRLTPSSCCSSCQSDTE